MGRNAKNIVNYYDFYPESVLLMKLLSQRAVLAGWLIPLFCSGVWWIPGDALVILCAWGVTQSFPNLPFVFLSVSGSSGTRGQQAVWLQATCTFFLFLSILLPPRLMSSWLLVSLCLSYQRSHGVQEPWPGHLPQPCALRKGQAGN